MSQEDARSDKKFSELAKEKATRVKQHVKDHKTAYIAGTTGVSCLIIGGVAGVIFGQELAVKVAPTAKNVMLLGYKSPQSIIQETIVNVAAKGSRGHIIVDGAGNVVGRSLREAAANEGISYTTMRNVCKGLRTMAGNGKTYTDLGENLSEQIKVGLA